MVPFQWGLMPQLRGWSGKNIYGCSTKYWNNCIQSKHIKAIILSSYVNLVLLACKLCLKAKERLRILLLALLFFIGRFEINIRVYLFKSGHVCSPTLNSESWNHTTSAEKKIWKVYNTGLQELNFLIVKCLLFSLADLCGQSFERGANWTHIHFSHIWWVSGVTQQAWDPISSLEITRVRVAILF